MSPISILLMMIVDTVAQVSAKGQWRPSFDIGGKYAHFHIRPHDFDFHKPESEWPQIEKFSTRIVPRDLDDEQKILEKLQAMLAFARQHLDAKLEAAA